MMSGLAHNVFKMFDVLVVYLRSYLLSKLGESLDVS